MKLQLVILFLIIIAFGMFFTYTQKDSIENFSNSIQPTISLPPGELNPIPSPTPLPPEQQAFIELQTIAQQLISDPASLSAVVKTTKGDITIELYKSETPFATANFYKKVKAGFYNGLTFHRVEDWVIQGGDPLGDGTGGGTTLTELTQTPFTTGSVGYAASGGMPIEQGQRISSGSQFFIVKQDAEHLNGQYTNFGNVVSGMDIVGQITIGDKILGITIQ